MIAAAFLQADDLTAINRFVVDTPIQTPTGQLLRDEWIRWFDGLSWWDRNFDRVTLDRGRNKRLEFQLGNATSEAERTMILDIARTGMSAEQSSGDPDRRDAEGHYSEIAPAGPFGKLALWGLGALGALALFRRSMR